VFASVAEYAAPDAAPPFQYDAHMPDSEALKPVGGGGRSFLGVRSMQPHDDGVHLLDDAGVEVAVVAYGERVYVNGRVMSFTAAPGRDQRGR
jgi:hypothetical protein